MCAPVRVLLGCCLFVLANCIPQNFACSRKIIVGDSVMGSTFQASTAGSVMLDMVPCNGTVKIGTPYTPMLSGSVAARYLVDVTTLSGEPFTGASFKHWSHTYNGATLKTNVITGNSTAWVAYNTTASGPRLISGSPLNCTSRNSAVGGSKLVFSSVGTVFIQVAWSTGPLNGVMVGPACKYTVVSATSTPTPTPSLSTSSACSSAPNLHRNLAFVLAPCAGYALRPTGWFPSPVQLHT